MPNEFKILEEMSPIELGEMDSIRLMNRIDTKYLSDVDSLGKILQKVAESGYRIFVASGQRIQEYRSMYFDTPSLQMYLDHHNGRLVRQKLRTRCYASSSLTFLEVKSKNNHGRTKKKRIEIDAEKYDMPSLGDADTLSWLDGRLRYPAESLKPALETVFSRITLVNPDKTERATLDFGVRFNNVRQKTSAGLDGLVIIEVKQDGNIPSRLREILLECRVKQIRISKYCIGTAMTDESVRHGRFKQKLIMINKLKAQI